MGRGLRWSEDDLTGLLKQSIKQAKENKFNAKKVTIDNIVFDSKKEGQRYEHLKMMQQAGKIWGLKIHHPIELYINGISVGTYVVDFMYFDKDGTDLIYEDVKGRKTPLYQFKKKVFEAIYGTRILET